MLRRRGYIFGMYINKYMFYLEKGEEDNDDSSSRKGAYGSFLSPPMLKYGKNGQPVYGCLDLG